MACAGTTLVLLGSWVAAARSQSSNPVRAEPRGAIAITRISLGMGGTEADGPSAFPSISADGRFVAFESKASNIVPNDLNAVSDIFVFDRTTRQMDIVSVDADGRFGDESSHFPSISEDGRYVSFHSYATLSRDDYNQGVDVYVRDRVAGTTTLVSKVFDGGNILHGYAASYYARISANGRVIAYFSSATNLIPDDANGANEDVFVYDVQRDVNELVSVTPDGHQGSGFCSIPSTSADGRFVSFSTNSPELVPDEFSTPPRIAPQVLVKDRETGRMRLGSVSLAGGLGDFSAGTSSLSGDGRYVAFYSRSTNLVDDDHNRTRDVYLFDFSTHVMRRLTPDGVDPNGFSYGPAVSKRGNRVAFWSWANNLVAGDRNGAIDVFLYDIVTEEISRISVGPAGEGNGDCGYPTISGNGRLVTFPSVASNLVGGDSNGVSDVFLAEIDF